MVELVKIGASAKSPAAPKKAKKKPIMTLSRWQTAAAAGTGAAALSLMALSLAHLAEGIEIIFHAPAMESRQLAFGIDFSYIAAEFAKVVSPDAVRKKLRWWFSGLIGGTMAGSALLNALAAAWYAEGLVWVAAAAVLSGAVPGIIYALTHITTTMTTRRS
jgi:hypothetical protein